MYEPSTISTSLDKIYDVTSCQEPDSIGAEHLVTEAENLLGSEQPMTLFAFSVCIFIPAINSNPRNTLSPAATRAS